MDGYQTKPRFSSGSENVFAVERPRLSLILQWSVDESCFCYLEGLFSNNKKPNKGICRLGVLIAMRRNQATRRQDGAAAARVGCANGTRRKWWPSGSFQQPKAVFDICAFVSIVFYGT